MDQMAANQSKATYFSRFLVFTRHMEHVGLVLFHRGLSVNLGSRSGSVHQTFTLQKGGFVKAAQFAAVNPFQWHLAKGLHRADADHQVA